MPFKGKAGSLAFLKECGMKVPEWEMIAHDTFVSWGDSQKFQDLQDSIREDLLPIIPAKAQEFADSVKIPAIPLKTDPPWAIRSSANLEDGAVHSYAGVFKSCLSVTADPALAMKEVWTSAYQSTALAYFQLQNLSAQSLTMDIIVQQMAPGLNGTLFQGEVDIISTPKSLYAFQDGKLLFQRGSEFNFRQLELILAGSEKLKRIVARPMDLEFCCSPDEVYFLQARPITVRPMLTSLSSSGPGIPCSIGDVNGSCLTYSSPGLPVKGKIVITRTLDEAMEAIFKKPAGIVCEEGHLLSHLAIVAREMKIPAIMGVKDAIRKYPTGVTITINGSTGEILF